MNRVVLPGEYTLYKYGLKARFVNEDDATFILKLRTDSKKQRYLSSTSNDVGLQKEWIQNYKIREREGNEYYFIFENGLGESVGLVRLYNFELDTYTSGSWLVACGLPEMTAFKIDLIAAEIGFEILHFKYCVIDVRKDNSQVVKYHKKFFRLEKEDEDNIYLIMDYELFLKKKKFLLNIIN